MVIALICQDIDLVGELKTLTIEKDNLGGVFLCLVCEENALC